MGVVILVDVGVSLARTWAAVKVVVKVGDDRWTFFHCYLQADWYQVFKE